MAYAVLQDLINRFGSSELVDLTDHTGSGQADPNLVGLMLADASSKIDSYLGSRYQLPFNPVPDQVNSWCCDIGRFLLYKDQVPDAVKIRYANTMAELRLAQSGALLLEAAAVDTPTNTNAVELDGPARMFDACSLRRF